MNADATEGEMRCRYLYQQCIPLDLSPRKVPIGVAKIEKEVKTALQVLSRKKHYKFVVFLEALSTEEQNTKRKSRIGACLLLLRAYYVVDLDTMGSQNISLVHRRKNTKL
jgi:hypothetical protein